MFECENFHDEIRRYRRSIARYSLRHHLHYYPRDLLRYWLDEEGALPDSTVASAYWSWKAGEAPRRRLYKGPPWRPPATLH